MRYLPQHAGMGDVTTTQDALDQLAPIQFLIDETHAGTATIDDANSAQAAVIALTSDLRGLPGVSSASRSSGITTAAAIIIGLGIGLVVATTAFAIIEHGKVAA
jgi:hypothetical protein